MPVHVSSIRLQSKAHQIVGCQEREGDYRVLEVTIYMPGGIKKSFLFRADLYGGGTWRPVLIADVKSTLSGVPAFTGKLSLCRTDEEQSEHLKGMQISIEGNEIKVPEIAANEAPDVAAARSRRRA